MLNESHEISESGSSEEYEAPERPGKYLKGAELVAWVIGRACLRKSNLTKEAADQIVDFYAAKKQLLYYYKCEFCGSYHMTHKESVGACKVAVI